MKILFIINKKRRDQGIDPVLLERFREILDASGREYSIVECGSVEESDDCLRDILAGGGCDAIWIGGGDGTINQILNSTFGQDLAYGIVPMGTVNALARALGLPADPAAAAEYLLKARPVPMDVGSVAGRYFFCYATVGIHAALFHNIDSRLKKRWGKLAFWESGIRTVWNKSRLPRFLMERELADAPPGQGAIEKDYGYSFVLSSFSNFSGFGVVTREASHGSDGIFELHHFRRNQLLTMLRWFALLKFLGIKKSAPGSGRELRSIRWCRVRSHRKLSLQIDGEPIKPEDRTHLEFRCLPGAVKVLLQPEEARRQQGEEE